MALSKEEDTLGEKHKAYNKLVQDAISNKKELNEKIFTADKRDLDNLMKIDIASHNRDIDYILTVLKSDDMLYVSRALKQCSWLVNDEYENIFNPEYLNKEIFPQMITKACIKLLKHIRHYLKTERRVEEFYNNESDINAAGKWLSRCSIPFIETKIKKHMRTLTNLEFKRLCEKSITIFVAGMEDVDGGKLKAASFLLNTHVNKYLDVYETIPIYHRPHLNHKATDLIMKQASDRIKSNFLQYINNIHVPTFVKHLKSNEVKDFLYELVYKEGNDRYYRQVFRYKKLKEFVKRMPKEEQFEFVKKVFLDQEIVAKLDDENLAKGTELFAIKLIRKEICSATPAYCWYEFAPFDTAFHEIKTLVRSESNVQLQYKMLEVLLICAGSNKKHLLTLLTYYSKYHMKDEITLKNAFVNKLLSQTDIYKDEESWSSFMELIKNFKSDEKDTSTYTTMILLYHLLHNKNVPDTIQQHFTFDTLTEYRSKLTQDEQNKVFQYLYNYIVTKLENHCIENKDQFNIANNLLHNLLDLLLQWDKHLIDYPIAINKIKELINIRKSNSWQISLIELFNKKKSWRRYMFEESVLLNPCQNVCVNALKHDPALLLRYKSDVEELCYNDAISLKQLLTKMKIYWPESLADNWTNSYLSRLDKSGSYKALVRGLFVLLPPDAVLDITKKYAPPQAKIDWDNINEITLGLQRSIAKNMHIARPQPKPDEILLYAKGDFLQYSLPSLLAIFYNLSRVQSQVHVPKLLDAPVSLQKHGLRLAFLKLTQEELKYHLCNVWKTSKNVSIRAVTFVLLFDLLCKQKDESDRSEELWELLEVFIDNLSFQEDKKVYEKLMQIREVPQKIKPKFLVKTYKFFKTLLSHIKDEHKRYEYYVDQLPLYTTEVMEFMCPVFVAQLILEYFENKFFVREVDSMGSMDEVISAYLLCAKDEESQNEKYENILAPVIKRSIELWNELHDGKYYIRRRLGKILSQLSQDLETFVIKKAMVVPTSMFTKIQIELQKSLSIPQNYIMLTSWKLTVKITEIIMNMDRRDDDWNTICVKLASECGKQCVDVLREDVKLYFSCIYMLYCKVLEKTVMKLLPELVYLQIYELMLEDKDFIEGYLVTLKIMRDNGHGYRSDDDTTKEKETKIKQIIREHPSVEVQMHYYNAFEEEVN